MPIVHPAAVLPLAPAPPEAPGVVDEHALRTMAAAAATAANLRLNFIRFFLLWTSPTYLTVDIPR
jgi:hypothetical protein